MGLFVGVAISCMYLVLASLFLKLFSVAELQLLTMGLSDMGFCVFSLGSIGVVLNPLEPTSTVVCGLIAVLCAAVH